MIELFIRGIKEYKIFYPIFFGYVFLLGLVYNLGFSFSLNLKFFFLMDVYDHLKSAILAIPIVGGFVVSLVLGGIGGGYSNYVKWPFQSEEDYQRRLRRIEENIEYQAKKTEKEKKIERNTILFIIFGLILPTVYFCIGFYSLNNPISYNYLVYNNKKNENEIIRVLDKGVLIKNSDLSYSYSSFDNRISLKFKENRD